MTTRPPDESDEPEAVDQVMLAVLSNRGRNATVLSSDQERLLDDWVAGRLAPDEAERAAALAKQNALAAERVLERRLLEAAGRSPSVPQELTARILEPRPAAKAPAPAGWWRSLGRRQWIAIAGAVALASIAAVVGLPVLQQSMRGGAPIQVAMATIGDRDVLFEPSDMRMRGTGPQQGAPADQRFRDVEVPTSILRGLLAAAAAPLRSAASREIEPYLPKAGGDGARPLYVVIDSALKQRVEADAGRDRMSVRIYNLEDPRAAEIRSLIGARPDGARAYLLTRKP